MKSSRTAATLTVLLALLSACQERLVSETFDPPYPETNASGDPIRAVFEGRVPCSIANCEKLKVGLVLYESRKDKAPTTYWLGVIGVSGDDRIVTQGAWGIRRGVKGYPQAPVYALDQHADDGLRYFWRASDDILLVLDPDMNPKAGNAAWGYMLSRYDAPYGPRTYTYKR